jgi:hypothetical protein
MVVTPYENVLHTKEKGRNRCSENAITAYPKFFISQVYEDFVAPHWIQFYGDTVKECHVSQVTYSVTSSKNCRHHFVYVIFTLILNVVQCFSVKYVTCNHINCFNFKIDTSSFLIISQVNLLNENHIY